jgi:hypothetical protein
MLKVISQVLLSTFVTKFPPEVVCYKKLLQKPTIEQWQLMCMICLLTVNKRTLNVGVYVFQPPYTKHESFSQSTELSS